MTKWGWRFSFSSLGAWFGVPASDERSEELTGGASNSIPASDERSEEGGAVDRFVHETNGGMPQANPATYFSVMRFASGIPRGV
jgi:hypothetical protein